MSKCLFLDRRHSSLLLTWFPACSNCRAEQDKRIEVVELQFPRICYICQWLIRRFLAARLSWKNRRSPLHSRFSPSHPLPQDRGKNQTVLFPMLTVQSCTVREARYERAAKWWKTNRSASTLPVSHDLVYFDFFFLHYFSRPTLSLFRGFEIRRKTFLNLIKIADVLILRL